MDVVQKKQYDDGKSPLTIPMSFFSGGGDNKSEASGTPGSTGSSFFMKMGKSVFTGRKSSMQSEGGMSDMNRGMPRKSTEPSPRYQYNFGTTGGGESPKVEVKKLESKLNAANLAMLQEQSNTKPEKPKGPFVTKQAPMNTANRGNRTMVSQKRQPGNIVKNSPFHQQQAVNPTISLQTKPSQQREATHGKRSIPTEKPRFGNEAGRDDRSKRSRSSLSLGSDDDESEFSLNEFEGYEVTNGSRPVPSQQPAQNNQNPFKSKPQHSLKPLRAPPSDSQPIYPSSAQKPVFQKPIYPSPAQKPSFTQSTQKQTKDVTSLAGTYDVFAPSGPIGIVVDTSKHGPAVHSLKATSPMLGLISPGDLIIALDGADTRTMTAASLTRLMAKKSRQEERKITLLSPDDL